MIVCLCRAVSDRDVMRAISAGATTLEAVTRATGAGGCCGACHGAIHALLERAAQPADASPPSSAPTRRSLPLATTAVAAPVRAA